MKEWKTIKGFEQYMVSNDGEVKSQNNIIMKPFVCGRGYLQVHLFVDGRRTKRYVHRLVAEAFCKKEPSANEVNHKDGNKQNNHADNLEWCTRSENLIHSYYALKNRVKPVICKETGVVYPSIKEAARVTGVHHTAISMCCDGRQQKTHGLHWGWAV